jgi:uncharacterized membrane protein
MKSYEDYKKEAEEISRLKSLYRESERDSREKQQKSLSDAKFLRSLFSGILGGIFGLMVGCIVAVILIVPVYLVGSLVDNVCFGFHNAMVDNYPIAHFIVIVTSIICILFGIIIGALVGVSMSKG